MRTSNRGVDDEALGITVNLGTSGEQTDVGGTEIEQSGLDRAGRTVCPSGSTLYQPHPQLLATGRARGRGVAPGRHEPSVEFGPLVCGRERF